MITKQEFLCVLASLRSKNKRKNMMNEEHFDEKKPTRKPDQRVKGTLLKWKDSDYTVFAPREASTTQQQEIIRESKQGKYYKNPGVKESSYALYCRVSGKGDAPAESLMEAALSLLKDDLKQVPKITARKFIKDEDGLKIWHDKTSRTLNIHIAVDTNQSKDVLDFALRNHYIELMKIVSLNKFK